MVARHCNEAVDAAEAVGVPASAKVGTTTFGKARATYCEPIDAKVAAILAAKQAAWEAQMAPYTKALKGDKLDLVMKWGPDWYGKGCKLLRTAKQLAKAKVWYAISVDTSGVEPRWTTRAYQFKGNALKGTKDRSGWGNDAPAKGCP